MTEPIIFEFDGREISAESGESIWQAAKKNGTTLPHLCHSTAPTYRSDGNCRACVVEVEGERVLAAACIRKPTPGMKVHSNSSRSVKARQMIFELLAGFLPERETSPGPNSAFWQWAEKVGQTQSRFSFDKKLSPPPDSSHPAMSVNLDSCIHCGLCVRACREVQVNDVIGMSGHGIHSKIIFDTDDPMGASSCVGCGECVQACPTGALLEANAFSAADKKVDSVCPYCGVGCQITYHVQDNRLTKITGKDGPANRGRLCVKGRFGYDYVHHPDRLTRPLIRRTKIQKAPQEDFARTDIYAQFREASWEEALDAAAEGFKRIMQVHGNKALAGFGSAKGTNEEAYLFQKLIRTGFGNNNVDHCTRLCHASSVAALMETIGSGAVTAPFAESVHSDVIFIIGANPVANHPVAATFFKNAAHNGTKLIIADPRGQDLSRHAHIVLRHNPGSDVALLNAMMNVIVTENLVDHAYIEKFTEGFADFQLHIAPFTPEVMTANTGLPAETIRQAARTFATAKRAMIFWGMGISQHIHGTDNARCLIALALMCGQIGRPGTGLHPLRGQNNVQGASDVGLIPMFLPDYQSVEDQSARARFETLWNAKIDPKRGLTVVEITDAIHADTIKGLYIMGENPAMSDPNLDHTRAALRKLEHLVVQDIFLTETAAYADVILPATAWPEKEGTVTNTDRRVQIGRAALAPPGDAKPDIWIIQELAKRLGLGWSYDGVADVFSEMHAGMRSIKGISWNRLLKDGAVTYPVAEETEPGHEIIFSDGFPTKSGKGRFVGASVTPPAERPDETYPFILTTARLLEHWHTGVMTRRSTVLNALQPVPAAYFAPHDLMNLQIADGSPVILSTRRGEIHVLAHADETMATGLITMPFCYHEAAVNFLTNDALDPYGKIPELKYCAAKVRLADN